MPAPHGITAGPDDALWFTEITGNKIGRITTGGTITEYAIRLGSAFRGITAGPDGALWFTERRQQDRADHDRRYGDRRIHRSDEPNSLPVA